MHLLENGTVQAIGDGFGEEDSEDVSDRTTVL